MTGLPEPARRAAAFEVMPDMPAVEVIAIPMFAGFTTEVGEPENEGRETTVREWSLVNHVDLEYCRSRDFTGKLGETLRIRSASPPRASEGTRAGADHATTSDVILVGIGDAAEVDLEALRRASAAIVRSLERATSAAMVLTGLLTTGGLDPARMAQAVVEGVRLAAYDPGIHKTERAPGLLGQFVLVAERATPERCDELLAGARRGEIVADAVCLARDLVNQPAGSMTPRALAEVAQRLAREAPEIETRIWDEAAIARERLGGLAGVSRGSDEPARMIRISYSPRGSESMKDALSAGSGERAGTSEPRAVGGIGGDRALGEVTAAGMDPGLDLIGGEQRSSQVQENAEPCATVVLVGKGITFDSGGLSIKSAEGMSTMKTDMSGAAAVLATFSALARLCPNVRVIGLVPAAENMPGPSAIKPGDILRARNGKTIEVLNTDAEGRLILADALCLACEEKPDMILDAATLTGACVVALGPKIAGLFGNDEELIGRVRRAGDAVGEPLWPLPLPRDYRSHIDSDIADMKNIGLPGGKAGALTAALLLAEFSGDLPWVHLDIAGPARCDSDDGYLRKGGTGFGVRTFLELLTSLG